MDMAFLKKFFRWQQKLSAAFDKTFLDPSYTTYGTTDFHTSLIPHYIQSNSLVYDIGGGKCPHIFPALKAERHIRTVGVDIDSRELSLAPAGGYDRILCVDITTARGESDGDFIISRSVLEHVKDTRAALTNMATFLKPGGRIIAYAPCRNAWFARLNMLLPEGLKRKLIDYFYADAGLAKVMGFKAYYNRCTPREIESIAREAGLAVVERRLYYMSNYFGFFTPLHIVWRFYQILVRLIGTRQYCEGFAYVLERPAAPASGKASA